MPLEAENRRLEVVLAAQREIAAQDLGLPERLELIANCAGELSQADGAAVELVENDELVLRATTGLFTPYKNVRYKISGISSYCFLNNKGYYCADAETDEVVDRSCCKLLGVRSVLVAPLTGLTGGVTGVLKVSARKIAAFTRDDVKYLQLLAGIAGLVLSQALEIESNIKLYTELARHKHLEEELKVNLAKEKELQINTGQFISLISHDFRTPLTAIQSSTELLQYYSDRFSAEKKAEIYERVHSSVRYLTEMLDNIALIGKARVGKLLFQPEPVSPGDLCKSLLSEFEPSDLTLHRLVYTGPAENKFVLLDKNLVRLILWHLVSNALKFSPGDTPIELNLAVSPGEVIFRVKDRGIGIPAAEQSHIYEIFFRASNVANVRGSGMGLNIVRLCLELHNGSITFTSELGQETTFTVTIPLPPINTPTS